MKPWTVTVAVSASDHTPQGSSIDVPVGGLEPPPTSLMRAALCQLSYTGVG